MAGVLFDMVVIITIESRFNGKGFETEKIRYTEEARVTPSLTDHSLLEVPWKRKPTCDGIKNCSSYINWGWGFNMCSVRGNPFAWFRSRVNNLVVEQPNCIIIIKWPAEWYPGDNRVACTHAKA